MFTLAKQKKDHKKWVVVTAYDASTAQILDAAGVDIILVGDSVGMVVLGYPSTAYVTMDEILHHAKAVRRGTKYAKLIADLPYKGVKKGPAEALRSARRLIREAGCDAVKLEWGNRTGEILKKLIQAKVPVMGHVGLTPQTVDPKTGFKVRGRTAEEAREIFDQALFFEKQGAFSVVLECIPSALSQLITKTLKIPTIGIGAGPFCDGQVLVFQDLVGLFTDFRPKHVKQYARGREIFEQAARSFSKEVRRGVFPGEKQSFHMKPEEFKALKKIL